MDLKALIFTYHVPTAIEDGDEELSTHSQTMKGRRNVHIRVRRWPDLIAAIPGMLWYTSASTTTLTSSRMSQSAAKPTVSRLCLLGLSARSTQIDLRKKF